MASNYNENEKKKNRNQNNLKNNVSTIYFIFYFKLSDKTGDI